jgi:hypothetical protein
LEFHHPGEIIRVERESSGEMALGRGVAIAALLVFYTASIVAAAFPRRMPQHPRSSWTEGKVLKRVAGQPSTANWCVRGERKPAALRVCVCSTLQWFNQTLGRTPANTIAVL